MLKSPTALFMEMLSSRVPLDRARAEHALDDLTRCGTPGVRRCSESHTVQTHSRLCHAALCECRNMVQRKAFKILRDCPPIPTLSPDQRYFRDMMRDAYIIEIPLKVKTAWGFTEEDLEAAYQDSIKASRAVQPLLPLGTQLSLRLDANGRMRLWGVAPTVQERTKSGASIRVSRNTVVRPPSTQGRPATYSMNVIRGSWFTWDEMAGGSWVGALPDVDNLSVLVSWLKSGRKRRVWSTKWVKRTLSQKLPVPGCPICGSLETVDMGFYNIETHDLVLWPGAKVVKHDVWMVVPRPVDPNGPGLSLNPETFLTPRQQRGGPWCRSPAKMLDMYTATRKRIDAAVAASVMTS